jgi:hypothetical protein
MSSFTSITLFIKDVVAIQTGLSKPPGQFHRVSRKRQIVTKMINTKILPLGETI